MKIKTNSTRNVTQKFKEIVSSVEDPRNAVSTGISRKTKTSDTDSDQRLSPFNTPLVSTTTKNIRY